MDLGWIGSAEKAIVQIATPYSTGTGFIFPEYRIIVTNEHVIRDNKKVIIEGLDIKRQEVEVLFFDEKYDVAFLALPENCTNNNLNIGEVKISTGDIVFALGHPFGLKFSTTKGIVSGTKYIVGDITYIQHDAALNPGNSGGPLLTIDGVIAGVNTFVVKEGQNIGIALPISDLKKIVESYQLVFPEKAVKCSACETVLIECKKQSNYCNNCGVEVKYFDEIEEYESTGINKKIEEIIDELGYDVAICRRGLSNWEINDGSVQINITYNEKSGFIIADATLGYLPKSNLIEVYTYLMKQNYFNKGIVFSLKEKNIVISSIIYDKHMYVESSKKIISKLIKCADTYDNLLNEQFGVILINQSPN